MILTGFAAAGSWRPVVSFEPAAPTQSSSCLGESWEAVNACKELQTERILSVFDQKLMMLILILSTKKLILLILKMIFQHLICEILDDVINKKSYCLQISALYSLQLIIEDIIMNLFACK